MFLQIQQQLLFYLADVLVKGIRYEFTAPLWQYAGAGGWHFVSLPKKMAKEIRSLLRSEEQGWGRLTATARIGKTEWKTAIWFDTKAGYLSAAGQGRGSEVGRAHRRQKFQHDPVVVNPL
ncbi:MAG: DUF1905 domain-containing protein [Candidatus Pollutiaquabacter aromativorans]